MAVEETRIRPLNEEPPRDRGSWVLYWMQQAQRAEENAALEHAIAIADERDQPVVVGFGLDDRYPEANERSFAFLLEGLAETAASLADRKIKLVVRAGRPDRVALSLAKDASVLVCDRGYLRHQRAWRETVAARAGCPVIRVEADVVVPIEKVSDKAEYAARTIRPKILRKRDEYVKRLAPRRPGKNSLPLSITGDLDPSRPDAILEGLRIDRSVGRVTRFHGGTGEARRRLGRFLRHRFPGYAEARNDPSAPNTSELSPYLHFGHISPVEIVRKVQASRSASKPDQEAFLEEVVVRRELAVNYVHFESDYDRFRSLPRWARATLDAHADDERPHRYTAKELERGKTHDPYWNAAMSEMRKTGFMHNYMRMYWGKKILEWCNTPEYAYRVALELNNRYFLDGRDPASYANVAWIFGLHDRPWTERDVFGKVRYMNAAGLERKFDIDAYVAWVDDQPES